MQGARRVRRPSRRDQCPPGSLVPVLFLRVVVIVGVVVIIYVVVAVFLAAAVVVIVVVVVVGQVQLDRRGAGDLEIRAAIGAADQVSFVDVEFVDLDLRVTLRAGGHTRS